MLLPALQYEIRVPQHFKHPGTIVQPFKLGLDEVRGLVWTALLTSEILQLDTQCRAHNCIRTRKDPRTFDRSSSLANLLPVGIRPDLPDQQQQLADPWALIPGLLPVDDDHK